MLEQILKFITENQQLVLIAAAGFAGFILIIVILSAFVFKPNKLKRMCRNIEGKYEHLHGILTGQDAQYVNRLEIISRTNLLYVDTHTTFSRKFKEIKEKNDEPSKNIVAEAREHISNRSWKLFKETYKKSHEVLNAFEKAIGSFTAELAKEVQPEEDARQASVAIKDKFRQVKKDYFAKESELSIMSESFKEIFEYIDSLFDKFQELVESAQYDEANEILPQISSILDEIEMNINFLPALCTLITKIVPEKIHEIELAYKDMIEDHYPLHNLFVTQTIDSMNKTIGDYISRIQQFDVEGIEEKLHEMLIRLDNFFEQFDKEKVARQEFDAQNDRVYDIETSIERRFIKIKNTIPEVASIYVINDAHNKLITELQKDVDKVATLKRSLDTYIHSSTKQPYSLLVNKMEELSKSVAYISEKLDEFDSYLESLKSDSETAYSLVFTTYEKVKKAEELVRLMNLQSMYAKYTTKIENIYLLLNGINSALITQPIDVDKVNTIVRELYESTNKLLEDGEISQDYNNMVLAESAIMYGNKHRNHLSDIDQLLSQAEMFFENGDFEKANSIAKTALSKIKQTNGR